MTLNEIRKMVDKNLPKQDFYYVLKDDNAYFTMDRKKAIFDYADALLGVYRNQIGKESVLSIPDNFKFNSSTLEEMLRTGLYYAAYVIDEKDMLQDLLEDGYWDNNDSSAIIANEADIIPFFFDDMKKNGTLLVRKFLDTGDNTL